MRVQVPATLTLTFGPDSSVLSSTDYVITAFKQVCVKQLLLSVGHKGGRTSVSTPHAFGGPPPTVSHLAATSF